MDDWNARTAALLGNETLKRLGGSKVLVVGVGGVGGWCAEALARTGVGHLTLVDDDTVAASNLNRQCAATITTLGRVKVEAMRDRILNVAPGCQVTTRQVRYPDATIDLKNFDGIVDAIDSIDSKAALILNATEAHVPLVSSMGAALRLDPTRVRTSRFDKVTGDGLARALRQRFRRLGRKPSAFTAVWSDEPPVHQTEKETECHRPAPRGSMMPVVATFGQCAAAAILRLLAERHT